MTKEAFLLARENKKFKMIVCQKTPMVFLIVGILFFAIQIFLSGLEEVPCLNKSMSRFIILIIPGLIGIAG